MNNQSKGKPYKNQTKDFNFFFKLGVNPKCALKTR